MEFNKTHKLLNMEKLMWYKKQNILITLLCLFMVPGVVGADEQKKDAKLNVLAIKAPQKLLMDIKSVADGRLVTVGERGHVLISDDKGENWQQIQVPTNALLTALYFIDGKTGWAVGHQQIILKTEDAGNTWQLQNNSDSLDQPALFDIWFSGANKGIAIGAYGLYLATEDGGETWNEVFQSSLEDEEIGFPHFYSLAFDNKSRKLFMAGEMGFLAVSDDIGKSWTKLNSPYHGSFFNIAAMPNSDLLVMGLRGHLFRSSDLGVSWTEVETGTISGLQSLLLRPVNNKILIVGSNGTQLESSDFGKTVTLIQRNDRVHLAGAISIPDGEVLLIGASGVLKAELH